MFRPLVSLLLLMSALRVSPLANADQDLKRGLDMGLLMDLVPSVLLLEASPFLAQERPPIRPNADGYLPFQPYGEQLWIENKW
ncbi:hypothetical protein K437DRAFT_258301 [Tilletiaria anomala UBC 951]|uniref:Uncharacterized protein n=1 Tax=Tilletiaria anomala (strain ATCC 24038 / CBS 436.72 / UBC 951) TaxID=1037660 RepID=A0A066VRB6_TILAU|nr:uncharacterized protein K437DRAFT_258301 [Tilletiaria anomala UBC 951]KDN41314.1 hypothetical protein K437DRAFT_258301 [Tilletiaria anomala UBC 951]